MPTKVGSLNGTTRVPVTDRPPAGQIERFAWLSVCNADTVSHRVAVYLNSEGTRTLIAAADLDPDGRLIVLAPDNVRSIDLDSEQYLEVASDGSATSAEPTWLVGTL